MQDTEHNTKDLPSFSFNIPTYNASEYLDKCLNSIFSQDYPASKIEVLIADGGSTDDTLFIAKKYPVKIFPNPRRLVDYASKINAANATGDLLVAFAADNELGSKGWLRKVGKIFTKHPDAAAFWCNMIVSDNDPKVNKYYELIKSDPLMFFINTNLQAYLRNSEVLRCEDEKYHVFRVFKDRPLVWGANGLVIKSSFYKPIMLRDEYIGDNDVFQEMIEQGNNIVAYSPTLAVYHHHLKSLKHWMIKWERNYRQHTLSHIRTRNMNWVSVRNLRLKLIFWMIYSLFPILSLSHATYLAIQQRNRYWFYHPVASFLQAYFLLKETLTSGKGIAALRNVLGGRGFQAK